MQFLTIISAALLATMAAANPNEELGASVTVTFPGAAPTVGIAVDAASASGTSASGNSTQTESAASAASTPSAGTNATSSAAGNSSSTASATSSASNSTTTKNSADFMFAPSVAIAGAAGLAAAVLAI